MIRNIARYARVACLVIIKVTERGRNHVSPAKVAEHYTLYNTGRCIQIFKLKPVHLGCVYLFFERLRFSRETRRSVLQLSLVTVSVSNGAYCPRRWPLCSFFRLIWFVFRRASIVYPACRAMRDGKENIGKSWEQRQYKVWLRSTLLVRADINSWVCASV